MLSDHPVLEFLNTTPMVEGMLQDLLQTDADVVSTLARLGWPTRFKGTGLSAAARNLREELRQLVESRKAEKPLDLARLNKFLGMHRVWEHRTPQQALAPAVESAADLLANGHFDLILPPRKRNLRALVL